MIAREKTKLPTPRWNLNGHAEMTRVTPVQGTNAGGLPLIRQEDIITKKDVKMIH